MDGKTRRYVLVKKDKLADMAERLKENLDAEVTVHNTATDPDPFADDAVENVFCATGEGGVRLPIPRRSTDDMSPSPDYVTDNAGRFVAVVPSPTPQEEGVGRDDITWGLGEQADLYPGDEDE